MNKKITKIKGKNEEGRTNIKETDLRAKEIENNKVISPKINAKGDITDLNEYLFHEGKHNSAYTFMGAHYKCEKRKWGVRFTTWAPKASNVYAVGDFSDFQAKEEYKMERISDMGLWSLFVPALTPGSKYKYCIVDQWGEKSFLKSDPYAVYSEVRPNTASIVYAPDKFKWTDRKWINKRKKTDIYKSAMNIYELHLGSWMMNGEEYLTYAELVDKLPKYVSEMGYTHVEIMPLVEHPLDASWGYQGIGFYSVTSRYGEPNDFRKLVNEFHNLGIGVIMDWVPGHFCRDNHGLYMFDGTPTYEYEETWKADNKGWGTSNFDLGKPEVKSFLISNAMYLLREFHIDGLRVDAVSNILYLDYGREDGEWVPNCFGDHGCLEGINFIKEFNMVVKNEFPDVFTVAEESTSWPKVSKGIEEGGLGFTFKWNMGWMNDTLEYVQVDPLYRKYHQNELTFSMMYNHTENFILPISHDEVVHGKKSLVDKMWGDYWNKFAGLRLYAAFMIGHPGKKLMFMGSEFAQFIEWREYESLEWKLIEQFDMHRITNGYFKDLNHLYLENKALWQLDTYPQGFEWIDADNRDQSVLTFMRKSEDDKETLLFICNFTPVVYYDFRIGVPYLADYKEIFNTDSCEYGGSGQVMSETLVAEKIPYHKQQYSVKIKVPPMGAVVLAVEKFNDIYE